MQSFRFEHVFRAASTLDVFTAYFDPGHAAEQDGKLDVVERTVLELDDTSAALRRVCRVVPRRQLPAIVRPLVSGPLHYVEVARWHKADDLIELDVRPSILSGRASITARYRLTPCGPGEIRRIYEGSVTVQVALISTRIERGIVAELERSLPLAAACTQAWLDRRAPSVAART